MDQNVGVYANRKVRFQGQFAGEFGSEGMIEGSRVVDGRTIATVYLYGAAQRFDIPLMYLKNAGKIY